MLKIKHLIAVMGFAMLAGFGQTAMAENNEVTTVKNTSPAITTLSGATSSDTQNVNDEAASEGVLTATEGTVIIGEVFSFDELEGLISEIQTERMGRRLPACPRCDARRRCRSGARVFSCRPTNGGF
jgi:hypothetical protein